uniref:Uncharacterized protein n=1 Tax=Meloidogyne enterolobii TaxID=390850 RepID=A0A6V7UQ88_MELEN|nr:unnamed protein product [Meloidogyne enterolobii]
MELRSFSKNLAREKYLKAKNEERQQIYYRNHHHHYSSHQNIHKIKYIKDSKEGKRSSKSSKKCCLQQKETSSSQFELFHLFIRPKPQILP